MRGVFWVTRAKDNLPCQVVQKLQNGTCGNILRDYLIALTGPAAKHYPVELRRVTALVDVDVELREMVFLTSNLAWSAQTIADWDLPDGAGASFANGVHWPFCSLNDVCSIIDHSYC